MMIERDSRKRITWNNKRKNRELRKENFKCKVVFVKGKKSFFQSLEKKDILFS
jgi:hypothetical protein